MKKNSHPIPTEAELSILNVLWEQGPSTVRDVCDTLNELKKTGYTTVLKLLQIMLKKKLVTRDESNRTHVYESNDTRQAIQSRLVDDLLKKAFGGSPVHMANTLFENEELSESEFEKLRNEILILRKEEFVNGEPD